MAEGRYEERETQRERKRFAEWERVRGADKEGGKEIQLE
jgi:hypothetical protein